jgi:hypothetical protein
MRRTMSINSRWRRSAVGIANPFKASTTMRAVNQRNEKAAA